MWRGILGLGTNEPGAIHRSTTQSLMQLSFLFCLILFPSARRCPFKSSYTLPFLQLRKLVVYLDCPSHPLAALSSRQDQAFQIYPPATSPA